MVPVLGIRTADRSPRNLVTILSELSRINIHHILFLAGGIGFRMELLVKVFLKHPVLFARWSVQKSVTAASGTLLSDRDIFVQWLCAICVTRRAAW
jgi:hypothetical protein